MKKKIVIFTLTFILFLSSALIGAILTSKDEKQDSFKVGFVEVETNAYFEKDNIIYDKDDQIEALLYQDGTTPLVKKGIFLVNITDIEDKQFIENFRVKFTVKSNVDTYFRIKFMQSKIQKTTNAQGVVTEYVLIGGFEFNLNTEYFVDGKDGYYYYKDKVKAIDEDTPLEVDFISSYFENQTFAPAPIGQELHVGFIVEAVQATGGPLYNWNLPGIPQNPQEEN